MGWNRKTSTSSAGVKPTANFQPRRQGINRRGRAKTFIVRAMDSQESSTMDYEGALKFLGLSENASSEDMVRAKNQMLSRYEDQEDKLKAVRCKQAEGLCTSLNIDFVNTSCEV